MLRLALLAGSLATGAAQIVGPTDLCVVVGACVQSPNYGSGEYNPSFGSGTPACTISDPPTGGPISVTSFAVEAGCSVGSASNPGYDGLQVNGVYYCGPDGPVDITPDGTDIYWYADGTVNDAGW